MKKLIFVISIFATFQTQAQTTPTIDSSLFKKAIYIGNQTVQESAGTQVMQVVEPAPIQVDVEKIYTFVEKEPTFQNANKDVAIKWIQGRIIYPAIARENGLQGKVFITFVVNRIGKIEDITIAKDNVGGGCAEETMRVIKSMPEWEPGKQNGVPVKVKITLPIVFRLESPKTEEVKH